MKKIKKSNVIMHLIIAAMLVVLVCTSPLVSQADSSDRPWSYTVNANSTTLGFIKGREKENSTKIYIYWISSYGGDVTKIVVSPYGAFSEYGTPSPCGTQGGGRVDAVLNTTGKYSVTNWVHELHYSYARPGFMGHLGSGTVQGQWSPDSIGTYNVVP